MMSAKSALFINILLYFGVKVSKQVCNSKNNRKKLFKKQNKVFKNLILA
jgi:hypothetical protein